MKAQSPFDDLIKDIAKRIRTRRKEIDEAGDELRLEKDEIKEKESSLQFVMSILIENNVEDSVRSIIRDAIGSHIGDSRDHVSGLQDELEIERDRLEELERQKNELDKMRDDYHRDHHNLAVQKKVCPFPNSCNQRFGCIKDRCNYDSCNNGHAFRWS